MIPIRVALYLRRSTNEVLQADSLNAQDELLRAYAASHNMAVVRSFQDSASGRTDKRDDFQALVDLVTGERADFEAVLVRDVSRWGRFENADEAAYYEFICVSRGVRIIYVEEPFRDDRSPWSSMMKSMKRVVAAEYSREKSRMTRLSHERSTRLGFWRGGMQPYGMKRVLVTLAGEFEQDLPAGTRKLVSNYRVKLAAGDPFEISVVRAVFWWYVHDGLSRNQIMRRLNERGVATPRGGRRWSNTNITGILRAESYIGVAAMRLRDPDLPASSKAAQLFSGRVVRAPGSWQPIIEPSLFAAAIGRLKAEAWSRMNRRAGVQLDMLGLRPDDLALIEALAERRDKRRVIGQLVAETAAASRQAAFATARNFVMDALAREFAVEETPGGSILLDGKVGIHLTFSLPHSVTGGLRWDFDLSNGAVDAIVCVGVAIDANAEARIHEAFVVAPSARKRGFAPLNGGADRGMYKTLTLAGTMERLRHIIPWKRCAKILTDALGDDPMFQPSVVGKRIGWSRERTSYVYRRLRAAGAPLPPPKVEKGRAVSVVCSQCSSVRVMPPSRALRLSSDVCGDCSYSARSKDKVQVTCTACGNERAVWPSAVKQLAKTSPYRCRPCSLRAGRDRRAEICREHAVARRQSADAVRLLTHLVASGIGQRAGVRHSKARAFSKSGRQQIYWSTFDGGRCRLELQLSSSFVAAAARAPEAQISRAANAALNQADWVPLTTLREADEAWAVLV